MDINNNIFNLEKQSPETNKWLWISNRLEKEAGVKLSPDAVRKRFKRYQKREIDIEVKDSNPDYKVDAPLVGENILIIGDTHLPFENPGYLRWLKELYISYNCDQVVHIGDVLDQHAISRFVSDPDGFSSGEELIETKEKIKAWEEVFPNMKICIGNHDERHIKLAMAAGLSPRYLRHFNDFLGVKNWEWNWNYIQEGKNGTVLYTHGTEQGGLLAHYNLAKNEGVSCVMGHTHTNPGVVWLKTRFKSWFGLNVGCGIDRTRYAFAYGAKKTYKVTLGAGLVMHNGRDPFFLRFND